MKTRLVVLSVCLFLGLQVQAESKRPHLALMSTADIHELMQTRVAMAGAPAVQDPVLHAGQRVYDWIKVVNQARAAAGLAPLTYSDPAGMTSPSMEHPKTYDADTGRQQFAEVEKDMPSAYRDFVIGQDPLPAQLPIAEDLFLKLGFRVICAYDSAARWVLMQRWLADLKVEKVYDVRGYVFLNALKDRDVKLNSLSRLPLDEQTLLRGWLVDICLNTQLPSQMDVAACAGDLAAAERKAKVVDYYQRYQPRAKMTYDLFFTLDPSWIRPDITWTTKDPQTVHYPFLEIKEPDIAAYFKTNVEDEWKGVGWHLSIDFTTKTRYNLSHLEYQPNTTAHAEGNKIVMDENEPRTEYISQWTIRHEFGHLLGFKDCYVEFYDNDLKKIVNYALDPTNLMCALTGHLQQQHADVLKARYFKP